MGSYIMLIKMNFSGKLISNDLKILKDEMKLIPSLLICLYFHESVTISYTYIKFKHSYFLWKIILSLLEKYKKNKIGKNSLAES